MHRVGTDADDDLYRQLVELAELHAGGDMEVLVNRILRERVLGEEYLFVVEREVVLRERRKGGEG